jgi:PAS domain S-box-containing protein
MSEARFRLAFDNAPIGMAIVGLDYLIKRVNKELCAAVGYSENELLGRKFVDITHPDDAHRDRELAESLIAGQIPSYRQEKRLITKDASVVWVDLTAVMISGEAQPLYGLAMVENITERKRAHAALRASEERYRSFVVNSSEGIWRFEIDQPIDTSLPADEQVALFYKHAYLAECNDALAKMYGHERAEDVLGLRFGNAKLASNPVNLTSLRKFITSDYRLHNVTTEQLETGGSRKYFSNNLIGIVINGKLLRIWGAQRDKTAETLAKRDLEKSHQQMRALAAYLQSIRERERASLAREMHDVLGQSLTSLKIEVSWLAKKLHSLNDGNLAPLDEKLIEIGDLLNETIVSVKSLSTELRPGVLDKLGLAAALEWQCEEFGRRSGIECDWKVPEEPFSITPMRSTAMFRILQEALTNVARHSDATSVAVELNVDGAQASLTVSDNGRGITNEQRNAPDSLGLLGMRERTEYLGGTFQVSGLAGRGTTVTVRLPLADPLPTLNGATQ